MPVFTRLIQLGVTGGLLSAVAPAMAQDAGGVPLGAGYFYPSVTIEEKYQSNIFAQSTNETDSWITTISPRAVYVLEGEFRKFTFQAGVSQGIYHGSSNDNYLDADLSAEAEFTPSDRLALTFGGRYNEAHDARGTGDSVGAAATAFPHPDEYHEWDVFGRVGYGLKELYAPRLTVEAGHTDTEYENNRARTAANDLTRNRLVGTFSFMVAPNTSLELEGSVVDTDYDTAASDSKKYKLLAGASWDATYQTTGFIKVGKQKADYKSSTDRNSSAWTVGVDWQPLSYATVNFSSSKDIIDSSGAGVGNATNTITHNLSWKHDWKSYLNSTAYMQWIDEDYQGVTREDETRTLGVSANYSMRNWLNLAAGLSHTEKSSSTAGLDYDDNIFSISARVGL